MSSKLTRVCTIGKVCQHLLGSTLAIRQLADAAAAGPVRMGNEVPLAPPETAFSGAAVWSIHVPKAESSSVRDILLRISYEGDIARLYSGGRLVTDDFYKGTPWTIGLRRLSSVERSRGLELRILPLRRDAPILFPGQKAA